MSGLSKGFKYKIEDKKLIIESAPDGIINMDLINDLLNNKNLIFEEIDICEGIKEIEEDSFRCLENLVKVTLPSSLKKIGFGAFYNCKNLKEVSFHNNSNNGGLQIEASAFAWCKSLCELNIPKGTVSINGHAFGYCRSLKKVDLPEGLINLGTEAFYCCDNLTTVNLPSSLEKISEATFCGCYKLMEINFPEGLKQIDNWAFRGCCSLKDISFPNSLVEIQYEAFSGCESIKNISFSEGLEQIKFSVFLGCKSLEEVVLPSSLKYIGSHTFASCEHLHKVVMNDGVEKMGESVFRYCTQLEDITLSDSLKEIPSYTFADCHSLKKIVLPDSVQILNEGSFDRCHKLKEVVLSKSIKTIPTNSFKRCDSLESIVIPDGVEKIEYFSFNNCSNLTEAYLPSTLKKFDVDAFYGHDLDYLYLKNKNDIVKLDVHSDNREFVRNPDNLLFLYCYDDGMCGFYKDGEYIQFNENTLLSNDIIAELINENSYDRGMYIKLYYWSKKRFIPSNIVIENMPTDDIDKFYINKNGQEWQKLINSCVNVNSEESKASFFKLCYVLGVFSESTSVRDRAVNFLNKKIVNVLNGHAIHARFDGFDLSNGFNEEYAEFFIKYYEDDNFMIFDDGYDDVDLICASYNNFKNVKKIYPNKTLHTNREADLLLPEHVMNSVRFTEYDDVDKGNEKFALTVGRYGYTQEQFEELQNWYNKGKSIKDMKLFINEDKEERGITYKLLDKTDSLNAVLGNITNCCQVIGGAGASCVEYGMTMPNSGFITFNYKDKIIGQSWVWYDEKSKTICLDNIEIPHKYLEKINKNKDIQKSFIDCLLRIEKNFKEEMNKKGLKVNKVTIGEGYNDIKGLLDKNFILIKGSRCLSDYGGYSDASSQYEIKKLVNNRKV